MALSKDDIRIAAERLDQAEKTRKQIRQISLDHPGHHHRRFLRDPESVDRDEGGAGPRRQRPQDRPHLEGDAERAQYRRAGFRRAARRHVLCRWRPGAVRSFHRHPGRGRTGVRHEAAPRRSRTAPCSTCSTRRTSSFRRWKFSTPASSGSIRKPNRRARSSTPSPTTRPTPASCSADVRCVRWMPTCAGSARCAIATASWKKPDLPPACSTIPPPASRGLANKIAPHGLALEAGQVVLAGSFIRPIETRKGDTIQADYGPYGTVSCYFT